MSKTKLLHSLRANLRLRHFSSRTEEAYSGWVRRFVRFHGLKHPRELGEAEVREFLTDLAVERHLGPATQARRWRRCYSYIGKCSAGRSVESGQCRKRGSRCGYRSC